MYAFLNCGWVHPQIKTARALSWYLRSSHDCPSKILPAALAKSDFIASIRSSATMRFRYDSKSSELSHVMLLALARVLALVPGVPP